jgi:hypothetical protein
MGNSNVKTIIISFFKIYDVYIRVKENITFIELKREAINLFFIQYKTKINENNVEIVNIDNNCYNPNDSLKKHLNNVSENQKFYIEEKEYTRPYVSKSRSDCLIF